MYAFLRRGSRGLRMDAPERYALAIAARMALRYVPGALYFRPRLWTVVLGRAARAFRNRRRYAGHHSRLHGPFRDTDSAHPAPDVAAGRRTLDRNRRCVRSRQPLG